MRHAKPRVQVGQRSDVLFTPTSKTSNSAIWMRTLQSGLYCARSPQNREGRAIIYMDNAPTGVLPNTTAWPAPVDDHTCANVSRQRPFQMRHRS